MIDRIEINNYQSYDEGVVYEFKNGLTLINGIINANLNTSNGSGKSSLLDAIAWCVYGYGVDTDKYPSGDHLIRHFPNEMSYMSVTIWIGGYKIYRHRKRGKYTELTIEENGKDVTMKTLDATQELINERLNMDRDTFLSTIYYRQKDSVNIADLTPKDSKQLLIKILGDFRWEKYRDKISTIKIDNWNILQTQVSAKSVLVGMIERMAGSISRPINDILQDISRLESVCSDFVTRKASLSDEQSRLEAELSNLSRNKSEIVKLSSDAHRLELDIDSKQKQLDKLNLDKLTIHKSISSHNEVLSQYQVDLDLMKSVVLPQEEIDEINLAISSLDSDIAETTSNISELRDEVSSTKTLIASTNNRKNKITSLVDKCDECLNLITPSYKENKLTELQAEAQVLSTKLTSLDNKIKLKEQLLNNKVVNRSAQNTILSDNNTKCRNVTSLETKISSETSLIESENRRLTDMINNIEFMRLDIIELKNKLSIINENIDVLNSKTPVDAINAIGISIGEVKSELEIIEVELSAKNGELRVLQDSYASIKTTIAAIETHNRDLQDMDVIIEELTHKDKIYNTLYDILSPQGIPSYIISVMSTNVSDIANNILSSIDIPYSINIKVFKEGKKSDKPIPTFDISILHKITGVVQNYSQFSGGESYWIDLVLRLAYMIISLYKKDSKISFMIFDEGIGRLDQANRDKFIELLKYTISTYSISQIFLVSHTDLSYRLSHFDDIITVRKDMDISRIQC